MCLIEKWKFSELSLLPLLTWSTDLKSHEPINYLSSCLSAQMASVIFFFSQDSMHFSKGIFFPMLLIYIKKQKTEFSIFSPDYILRAVILQFIVYVYNKGLS